VKGKRPRKSAPLPFGRGRNATHFWENPTWDSNPDAVSPSRIDQFYDTRHPIGGAELMEKAIANVAKATMEISTDISVLKVYVWS